MVKILERLKKRQNISKLYSQADEILAEFLNILKKRKSVQAAILYGSYARGVAGPKSDIDIFVLSNLNKKRARNLEAGLNKVAGKLEISCYKKFKKLCRIQCLVHSKEEKINPELLKNILKEGKIIFARGLLIFPAESFGLNHFLIYTLDMRSMKQSQKSKVSMLLHGKTSSFTYRGKKTVKKYKGILEMNKAEILAPGCFLVQKKFEDSFEHFLEINSVVFSRREVVMI